MHVIHFSLIESPWLRHPIRSNLAFFLKFVPNILIGLLCVSNINKSTQMPLNINDKLCPSGLPYLSERSGHCKLNERKSGVFIYGRIAQFRLTLTCDL